jgi:TolB-like protein/cytochrome c-type biogenesis protein CcmH/NrfG
MPIISSAPDTGSAAGAVFLSYASEDALAARAIADALADQGIEVWFDRRELRGGDAWDEKIRRQIKACALFLPVISARTQARKEGYFRLEWKLAVERTHQMAEGVPFLAPVEVDEISEGAALVPAEFLRVQWIRLAGGRPTTDFVGEIKRLLQAPVEPRACGPAPLPLTARAVSGGRLRAIGGIAAAVAILLTVLILRRSPTPSGPAPGVAPGAATPTAVVDGKSVAVLPFENMSQDKDNGFFSDGVHEDVLTDLSLIPDLHVTSRTSVLQYRGTTKSIKEIGRELGVAFVLEGSVRRENNTVRVTGQLIDARTDQQVWAKAFDRNLNDIFAIQSELAQAIASALQAAISPTSQKLIERHPTENLASYDLWLKARQIQNEGGRTPTSQKRQEELLRSAVDLDPNFAQAWGDLAVCLAYDVLADYDQSTARLAEAQAAIDQAVRLAPDLPDVIKDLGNFYYYAHLDYRRAQEEFQRLAALRPNDATVYSSLGLIERRQGDWGKSLASLRKATQLDPANGSYSDDLFDSLFRIRRYEEAALEKRRQLDLDPDNLQKAYTLVTLGFYAHGSTRETDEFFAALPAAKAKSPRGLNLRRSWARTKGDFAEAVRIDKLQPFFDEDGAPHFVQAVDLAMDLIALNGDHHAAREQIAPFAAELRSKSALEPNNAIYFMFLGVMESILGHSDAAIQAAKKAVQLTPMAQDQIGSEMFSIVLAAVRGWNGQNDEGLRDLSRLIALPNDQLNVYALRFDPLYLPFRGDPRFEALLRNPANQAPLY